MLRRLAIASVGASVITLILFYGMSEVAEYFNRPDSEVYLRVMDIIPGSGQRRLPDRRMPEAQPERTRVEQSFEATQEAPGAPAFEGIEPAIDVRVELPPPDSAQPR